MLTRVSVAALLVASSPALADRMVKWSCDAHICRYHWYGPDGKEVVPHLAYQGSMSPEVWRACRSLMRHHTDLAGWNDCAFLRDNPAYLSTGVPW